MRDMYKNPMFYYLLVPVLVGMWPVLVWGVYLPRAQDALKEERSFCLEGRTYVLDILVNDPARLDFAANEDVSGEFSYAKAIDRVSILCRIPSSKYNYSAGNPGARGVKESQNARVGLTDVGIVQAAQFLSTIQSMWVNLKCDKVKLTRKKGLADQWDVDLNFWYYY